MVNESDGGAKEATEACMLEVDDDNLCSREAIQQLLRTQDDEFNRRLVESETRQWCNRVPRELVLNSVHSFYQDLHSRTTLATGHCHLCQQMTAQDDLHRVPWQGLLPQGSAIRSLIETSGALECRECFPVSPEIGVPLCSSCYKALVAGRVPRSCAVNNLAIGCFHRYPEELRGRSPMEERLISLAQPYGWVTKIEISVERKTSGDYRKLKKGHITVFPNKLESLVRNVLPAPVVEQKESMHVCFLGPRQLLPKDLSFLLRVRPAKIRAALIWLKQHNPLYQEVEISTENLEQYADAVDEVPRLLLEGMERYVPTARDVIETGHYVSAAERGRSDTAELSIEEVLASLRTRDMSAAENPTIEEMDGASERETGGKLRIQEEIEEITSSGMMAVDIPPAASAFEKLEHLTRAMRAVGDVEGDVIDAAAAEPDQFVAFNDDLEPFIVSRHGDDFEDTFAVDFFPKVFPCLFPRGRGGPRNLDTESEAERDDRKERNFTLRAWSRLCLLRCGKC